MSDHDGEPSIKTEFTVETHIIPAVAGGTNTQMTYTIFCVFDTEEDCPFKIEINETMSIAHLQQAIKAEEPAYAGIAVRKFKLYSINARDINDARAKSQDLSKLKSFEAHQTISDAFGSAPGSGLIHLFIKTPRGNSIKFKVVLLLRPCSSRSHG